MKLLELPIVWMIADQELLCKQIDDIVAHGSVGFAQWCRRHEAILAAMHNGEQVDGAEVMVLPPFYYA